MADQMSYLQGQDYQLAGSGCTSSATSITLVSLTYPDGTTIVTADLGGGSGYGTLEPETSREENISFTGITQNASGSATLTGVTRGLKFKPDYTADATLQQSHAGGSTFRLTNSAPFYSTFANKKNEETIEQVWTFTTPNIPQSSSSTELATSAAQYITKYYFDTNGGSTPLTTNRVTVAGTAGETVASGNLVYMKVSDGRWWLADADLAASSENVQLGIAQGAGTAGVGITNGVAIQGLVSNMTGLTANTKYYVSNTAGAISTTPGTQEVTVGESQSTTSLLFVPRMDQQITEDQQDALVGTNGTPSANNLYVTNTDSTSGIDQSQTTQDATVAVGEANATTKKNKLAQSFIATTNLMTGFKLHKIADTGTFTGDFTVTLQADSGGSPSGVALATSTVANAVWALQNVGLVTFNFASNYATTPGTTYWLVIATSTSDNSNHPNFGTNSAGGYTNGSVKFNNTTDGWVAIATIDLTFYTLASGASKIVRYDTTGTVSNAQLSYAVDAGATDAYEIDVVTNDTAYVTGRLYTFKANTANTGTATLNVNGMGAKNILKNGSKTLNDGDIASSQIVQVQYDGTQFQMQSQPATFALTSAARIGSGSVTTQTLTVANGAIAYPFSDETFDTLNEMDNGYQAVTCTASTNTTTVVASGATFTASDVGRWWYNSTRNLAVLISGFNSSTSITVGTVASQASGDTGYVYGGKFTAAATGYYQVNFKVPVTVSAATTQGYVSLAKNGSVTTREIIVQSGANTGTNWSTSIVFSDVFSLTAGDTLQVIIQSLSATWTWGANPGAQAAWFSVKRVS